MTDARTRDGRAVTIYTRAKPGMSFFKVFGEVDGQGPCHWTSQGTYRLDGKPHDLDLVDWKGKRGDKPQLG